MELRLDIENNIALLGSVNYKNHQLSNDTCSLYNEPDFLKKLDYIVNEFQKQLDIQEWSWNHYHEIINLNFFKKNGVLDYLYNKFGNRLKIVDNNIGKNHNGKPFFLGLTHPTKLDIDSNKEIRKTFLCMNLHEKKHRTEIFNLFNKYNLFDISYFSYLQYNESHPFHKKLPSETNFELEIPRDVLPCYKPEYKPIEEHKYSFCSVVTETLFYSTDMGNLLKDSMFITEKTEKCFSSGHPFIIVGRPFFLKKLKELGFKTFDRWWDESYDEEEDDNKRLDKIKKTILHISKFSNEDILKIYKEMIPILMYNQKNNEKYYNINKKICSTQFLNHECNIESIYITL